MITQNGFEPTIEVTTSTEPSPLEILIERPLVIRHGHEERIERLENEKAVLRQKVNALEEDVVDLKANDAARKERHEEVIKKLCSFGRLRIVPCRICGRLGCDDEVVNEQGDTCFL